MQTPPPLQPATVDDLFARAAALPAMQRAGFLDAQCAGDPALRRRLDRLLTSHDRAGAFLERPVTLGGAAAGDAPGTLVGRTLGEFRILAIIASGGMGTVYEAEQEHPRRRVALKVIRPGLLSVSALRRFGLEIELLGRLQHPGIAQIYGAGSAPTDQGVQPFFAMELVRGRPLLEAAAEAQLDPRGKLDLFIKICDAVHHAHANGIVHRDLKPANIVVDGAGQPRILDFGVARATGSDLPATTAHSSVGQLIGTIPYMSPEQVLGDPWTVDARSDVYSLGVILYELLAGRRPLDVEHKSLPEAVRIIREEEPTRLGSACRACRGELDTIVGKAMEKDRDRRYQSAAELADDARRYLRDEPIVARPSTTMYQLRKFARRNRALVWGTGAALVALVLGMIGTTIGLLRAVDAQGKEREERTRADLRAAEARRRTYIADISAAESAIGLDDVLLARARLDDAPEELRNWEWRYLRGRLDGSTATFNLTDWMGPGAGGSEFYGISPDGRLAAVVGEGEIRVVDLDAARIIARWPALIRQVRLLIFSRDGSRLAATEGDRVFVFDLAGTAPPFELRGHTDWVDTVDFSPDGSLIATGAHDSTVRLWDAATGQPAATLGGHAGDVVVVRFGPDGRTLASGGNDSTAIVWDVPRRRVLVTLSGHAGSVSSVAFDATGERLVTSSLDETARLWNVRTGQTLMTLRGHKSYVEQAAWSGDGTLVATAGRDRTVRLWDTATGRQRASLRGHASTVRYLGFGPAPGALFSGSDAAVVKRWSTGGPADVFGCRGHLGDAGSTTFSPDSRFLASVGRDTTVRVWDPATGHELATLIQARMPAHAVAFSADSTVLAVGADDGSFYLWDPASAKLRSILGPPASGAPGPQAACFLPGGDLATMHSDGDLRTWDPATGAERSRVHVADQPASSRFHPAGSTVCLSWADGRLVLWDIPAGAPAATLNSGIRSPIVALSPRRPLLAVGGDELVLLDLTTGARAATLTGHTGRVLEISFSPDGTRLASASVDGTLKLWDVAWGECVATFNPLAGWAYAPTFSPDGRRIACGSSDGELTVWTAADQPRQPEDPQRSAARADASVLFRRLLGELGAPERVAEHLARDTGLPAPVRTAAIQLARTEPGRPEGMAQWCWGVVLRRDADAYAYRRAAAMAAALMRGRFQGGPYSALAGAAAYRRGDLDEAGRLLNQALPHLDASSHEAAVVADAFLAMTLSRQKDPQAPATLRAARAAALRLARPLSAEATDLLREAQEVVGPAGSGG